MSLYDYRQPTDKWCPGKEDLGTVYLEQSGDEIIVSEDSVTTNRKVRIINRKPCERLPDHKVKVRKVEKVDGLFSDYSYKAKVIDDDIQQNTENAQQDVDKRRKTSDPFSTRRKEMMTNLQHI
jgi:hypothetical protein